MSQNDVLALKANFNAWMKNRMPAALPNVDPFEFYCNDQFLRQFAVSDEELLLGLVGGGNDGGADGAYFLINKKLIQEDTEIDAITALRVNLLIFQIKQTQGFSPVEIEKLRLLTDDLLDLSRQPSHYHNTYNSNILKFMKTFKAKSKEIAGNSPDILIDYYYITQCDEEHNRDAQTAADRVKRMALTHFSSAKVEFHFINAQKLWNQVQLRAPKTKALTWSATPLQTPEGWIGLVKLFDYWQFLRDQHGDLEERIFESNVRGFQQNTSVNVDIRNTLDQPGKADFWLLNNGITILTPKAQSSGYQVLEIDDPQIVNGLQTSRQIDAYYRNQDTAEKGPTDARRILVRVLQSSDETVRDNVIRATNSQNKIPPEVLRTTDRIHAQIEAHFKANGFYYDRRKGQYKDEGKPISQIVSVLELLQSLLAVFLKRPDDARARQRDYIKDEAKYSLVFENQTIDLKMYLKCLQVQHRVEQFISRTDLDIDIEHQRNLKYYLAMYAAAAVLKNAYLPPDELVEIDIAQLTDTLLRDSYSRIWKRYENLAVKFSVKGEKDYDALAKGPNLLKVLTSDLKRRFHGSRKRKSA